MVLDRIGVRASGAVPLSGHLASALTISLIACGPGQPGTPGAEVPATPLDAVVSVDSASDLVRTADPFVRGYTEADFPRVKELAPGVYSYEALRSAGDERFTTVSMFVVSEEGVLVADGQGNVAETERLIAHIADITDAPVTHVVVCSDHGDHTAGNSAFPEDAEFIAHPTSAEALRRMAEDPDRPASAPPVPMATMMVEERAVLTFGGRTVEVIHLGRAHTGGDLVVHLPEERILFMSEAYLHSIFPAMRSAYPSEWVAMIERAQAMDVDQYVPGHGFVDSPDLLAEGLEMFRRAIIQVIDEATRLYEDGFSLEDAQAQARFGELDEWSLYSSQAARAVRQVYRELDGELGS